MLQHHSSIAHWVVGSIWPTDFDRARRKSGQIELNLAGRRPRMSNLLLRMSNLLLQGRGIDDTSRNYSRGRRNEEYMLCDGRPNNECLRTTVGNYTVAAQHNVKRKSLVVEIHTLMLGVR